ncbi:MAG: hypothetical protein R2798_14385 [Chitinophagales bacterium]|nr:hypothetical protein [Bacteroidota bacterium]MCB9043478.1 hypothetical protein [Chitinophagales bacterium]
MKRIYFLLLFGLIGLIFVIKKLSEPLPTKVECYEGQVQIQVILLFPNEPIVFEELKFKEKIGIAFLYLYCYKITYLLWRNGILNKYYVHFWNKETNRLSSLYFDDALIKDPQAKKIWNFARNVLRNENTEVCTFQVQAIELRPGFYKGVKVDWVEISQGKTVINK